MTKEKNKKLEVPSFKKSISDFLKNESGSVSTKSALAVGVMGAATVGLSGVVEAASCDVTGGHYNFTGNGVYFGNGESGAEVTEVPSESCLEENYTTTNYTFKTGCTPITCTDVTGIMNGHYNMQPSCTSVAITNHCSHTSSGDSGDSGDGGDSCG